MARTVERHLPEVHSPEVHRPEVHSPEVHSDEGLALLSHAVSGQAPEIRVMTLLQEHVPLSLLCDLAATAPLSAEILAEEGLPDDEWWAR